MGQAVIPTSAIINSAVTLAKMQDLAALSVLGRAGNTSGVMAAITGTDGQVLRVSGTTLGFGTIVTAGIDNNAVTLAKLVNASTNSKLLGRFTAGAGNWEEITISTGLALDGSGNLTATSGGIGGSGTANYIAKFTGTNTVGNSIVYDNGNIVVIGDNSTIANSVGSRFMIYGGKSSVFGANLDVLPVSGDYSDQAIIELMGSDYQSQAKSSYLLYRGVSFIGNETITGVSNANLGLLRFSGADNALITTSGTGLPIRFFTGATEVIQITNTGIKAVVATTNTSSTDILVLNGSGIIEKRTVASFGFVTSGMTNPMTTLGDIIYGGASGAATRLGGDTSNTKKFLTSTSSGGTAAAPAWNAIVAGDIPTLGGNPSATIGLTATNGSATTYLRSDAAPALDVTISPTWSGTHTFAQTGLLVKGATANALTIKPNETLTAGRILNIIVNDATRTINITGDLTLAANLTTSGANPLTLTTTGSTNVTLPTTGTLATRAGAETITNKRIQERKTSTASASSLTPDISSYDHYEYTALAAALTINAPTGTPVDGETLIFGFKDNATARGLTWDAAFVSVCGTAAPSTTVISKWTHVFTMYNAGASKWHITGVIQES